MAVAQNRSRHAIDLTGGETLAPWESENVNPAHPHEADLIEQGHLVITDDTVLDPNWPVREAVYADLTDPDEGEILVRTDDGRWVNSAQPSAAVIKEAPYNLLLAETGITGDGVTNDLAALQAVADAYQPGYEYLLPTPPDGGHYKIQGDSFDLPDVRGITLRGENSHDSEIRQYTDNIPVIRSLGQFQRQRHITDLKLAYQTEQPPGNTGATALEFVSAEPYSSFYWGSLKRLHFYQCRKGIGTNTPGIDFTCWNNDWAELLFEKTSWQLIDIVPGANGGIPVNNFSQIRALNNLSSYQTGVGPALNLHGEFVMDGLDVEDWHGLIMVAGSGMGVINGVHIERHRLDTAFGSIFYLANGRYTLDQINIGDLLSTIDSSHSVITADDAGLDLGSFELVSGPTKNTAGAIVGLGQIALLQTSNADHPITMRTPKLGTHAVMPLVYLGTTAEKSVCSLDGGPAPYEGYFALPAAVAALRGRQFFVKNGLVGGAGDGFPDMLYTCVRLADGSYEWRATSPSEPWRAVGAAGQPAFQNAWVNFGGGQAPAAFYKTPDGLVIMKGLVKNGTISTTIFTLPAGYRPAEQLILDYNSAYGAAAKINTNGTVVAPGANANIMLRACFRAEA